MAARCCHCRRTLGICEVTYLVEHEDGADEWCEDCDAELPPQLRPSLGYVPALLRSVARGELGDAVHMAGSGAVRRDPDYEVGLGRKVSEAREGSLHGITQADSFGPSLGKPRKLQAGPQTKETTR
jgi:hypothetical protein